MKKQEFLEGIRDGIPICLGYFSVSMAFGLTAVLSGVDGNFAVCLIHQGGDVKEFANTMKTALNGRGGGKPNFQQGRVSAPRQEIEAFFAER